MAAKEPEEEKGAKYLELLDTLQRDPQYGIRTIEPRRVAGQDLLLLARIEKDGHRYELAGKQDVVLPEGKFYYGSFVLLEDDKPVLYKGRPVEIPALYAVMLDTQHQTIGIAQGENLVKGVAALEAQRLALRATECLPARIDPRLILAAKEKHSYCDEKEKKFAGRIVKAGGDFYLLAGRIDKFEGEMDARKDEYVIAYRASKPPGQNAAGDITIESGELVLFRNEALVVDGKGKAITHEVPAQVHELKKEEARFESFDLKIIRHEGPARREPSGSNQGYLLADSGEIPGEQAAPAGLPPVKGPVRRI